jgi:ribosomal-protein-alanine N-acetyltransferase
MGKSPVPVTRLVTLDDAPDLARLAIENRNFLAPWEPVRDERWYTEDAQRENIATALERHAQGTGLPHVILDESQSLVGRITLNGITRGAFQSCSVGYWVSEHVNGRGLASAALEAAVRIAFDELQLHRVQAETVPHNYASQRVLERNGFVQVGMAPEYLNIAGRWQDHLLFQRINADFDAMIVTAAI